MGKPSESRLALSQTTGYGRRRKATPIERNAGTPPSAQRRVYTWFRTTLPRWTPEKRPLTRYADTGWKIEHVHHQDVADRSLCFLTDYGSAQNPTARQP